jgi:hypothetical protein
MHNVWDSPAWHNLRERGDFCTTRGNLTFSYYVDWFNPFLNKIGGKHVSCGAIVMVCLNLPPELRHKPENIFIASIIPPDCEPDVVTFTHVADPVIDQLVPFYAGQDVPTFSHPSGEMIRIAVLPFIGDIPAVVTPGVERLRTGACRVVVVVVSGGVTGSEMGRGIC